MNSDEERTLFDRWNWTLDIVGRKWVSPEHGHTQDGRNVGIPAGIPACQQTLSLDDLVAATRTPEGEGVLVGFVISHGVRKR